MVSQSVYSFIVSLPKFFSILLSLSLFIVMFSFTPMLFNVLFLNLCACVYAQIDR